MVYTHFNYFEEENSAFMGETNRKEESYAHSVIISCEKSTYDRDLHLLRSAVLSYLTDNHVLQVRLRYYVPLQYPQ